MADSKVRTLGAVVALFATATAAPALAGLPPPSAPACWYVSGTRVTPINRGDIILKQSDSESPIGALMTAIDQTYTHTGLAVSSTSVRHNSMNDSKINYTYGALGVVPNGLKATGDHSVRDGW